MHLTCNWIDLGLVTSRNKNSSLVLKPCKFVKEISQEVLFIKVQQIARQIDIYWHLMLVPDSCSTETVSIENYEIQIFKSVFTHIQVYLCKISFLTTLDIYKDYFKSRLTWCKVIIHAYFDQRQFALIHYLSCRSYCVFATRVL